MYRESQRRRENGLRDSAEINNRVLRLTASASICPSQEMPRRVTLQTCQHRGANANKACPVLLFVLCLGLGWLVQVGEEVQEREEARKRKKGRNHWAE